MELDAGRNGRISRGESGEITAGGSRLKAWVIPTDEELMIARDTYRVVAGAA
jgi:acetate kinase